MTTASRSRPGGVIAVAIIGLVLGSLGLFGGAMGTLGALNQDNILAQQRAILEASAAPGVDQRQIEAQVRMTELMIEAQRPYMPAMILGNLLNALASGLLCVAAVLLLMGHARGPLAFTAVAGLAALADVLFGALGIYVTQTSTAAMQQAMQEIVAVGSGPGAEEAGAFLSIFGSAMTTATLCWAGFWVLLKLGYYVSGALYLNRAEVKATFQPLSSPASF